MAPVNLVDDPSELAIRLCEQRDIVAQARTRARVGPELVDDSTVLARLRAFVAAQPSLDGAGDDVLAHTLAVEAGRVLRECLVATLRTRYDLDDVVRAACEHARIPGREGSLAYCLAVLCQKADTPRAGRDGQRSRHYLLDVGSAEFPERLRHWARTIAVNLRAWAPAYQTIQEEADRYEIGALCELVRPIARDDIMDVIATKLAGVIAGGEPLAAMTLERASSVQPAGREYIFQVPLPQWARTIARRDAPRQLDSIERIEEEFGPLDGAPAEADAEPAGDVTGVRAQIRGQLVARIAALRETRGLLGKALALADDLDGRLARQRLADERDDLLLLRIRAELLFVADLLRDEQRAIGGMLGHIALAMRGSPKRQQVAILSLRDASLEAEVSEDFTARMRALASAGKPPRPALITGVAGADVPAARHAELVRLRDDEGYRAKALGELGDLLDRLPAHVAGIAGICAAMGDASQRAVTVTRGQAADELAAVERASGRAFRRYAMGVVK